jgi:hypothetical protein
MQMNENSLVEYKALRDEILKRIEMRQNILSITLALAAAFLSAGILQRNQSDFIGPSVAFIYPPIAACLALGWAQIDHRIRDIGIYIRDNIEKNTPGLGWEIYLHGHQMEKINSDQEEKSNNIRKKKTVDSNWRSLVLSHGGVFVCTQIMAIVIGCTMFECTMLQWGLLIFDLIMLGFVIWILRKLLGTKEAGSLLFSRE